MVFSSTAPDFAIDQVAAAAAPEPSLMALAGLALVTFGAIRPRRNR